MNQPFDEAQPGTAAPAAMPAAAPAPQNPRRVGTITMGLTFIASGVVFLLHYFVPQFDVFTALRLFPVVLIALGAEILIFNAKYQTGAFRYDFVSSFLCLILVGAAAVSTVAADVWQHYAYSATQESALQQQIEDSAYGALGGFAKITSLRSNVSIDWRTAAVSAPDALPAPDYIGFSVVLDGGYASEQDFAKDCRYLIDTLFTIVPHIDYVEIRSAELYTGQQKGPQYTLYLSDRFSMRQEVSRLADNVDTLYWDSYYESYTDTPPHYLPEDTEENPAELDGFLPEASSLPASAA